MAVKTPQQALDNYVRGMQGGAKAYTDGINGYSGNPMALAASDKALADYAAACQRSVTTGHRSRRLLATNPAIWKANATGQGAANFVGSVNKSKTKLLAVYQGLQQVWQAQNQLKTSMPGADRGTGKARMNAAFDLMVAYKDSQM